MSPLAFRLLTIAAGILLGLGGFVLACLSLTFALISSLGTVAGFTTAAAILFSLAALTIWIAQRPIRKDDAQADQEKSAASGDFKSLPLDVLSALVRKHPATVVLAALMLGYTLIRDPGRAVRQAQSMLLRFL